MDREEAIKIVRENMHLSYDKGNIFEALETLVPELRESEDERIINQLINLVNSTGEILLIPTNKEELISWLEKKKEEADKRLEMVELHCKEVQDFDKKIQALRKEWYGGEQKEPDKCPEYCVRSHCMGCSIYEKQKEQIPYIDFVIKPHKGDDNNPYDMQVSEAQEYAIKRGFGIPFNDGEVYVDERHMTQTIGNILRWADGHPKEQKPENGTVLKGFVAVDYCDVKTTWNPTGRRVSFFTKKPVRDLLTEIHYWASTGPYYERIKLGYECFPELKWEDEPVEVELLIYGTEQKPINESNMHEPTLDEAKKWNEAYEKGYSLGYKNGRNEQKPAEWSEEDSRILYNVIAYVGYAAGQRGVRDDEFKEANSWLKSLRPQWRPSEEQMGAFSWMLENARGNIDFDPLKDLYEQLKKLMED